MSENVIVRVYCRSKGDAHLLADVVLVDGVRVYRLYRLQPEALPENTVTVPLDGGDVVVAAGWWSESTLHKGWTELDDDGIGGVQTAQCRCPRTRGIREIGVFHRLDGDRLRALAELQADGRRALRVSALDLAPVP